MLLFRRVGLNLGKLVPLYGCLGSLVRDPPLIHTRLIPTKNSAHLESLASSLTVFLPLTSTASCVPQVDETGEGGRPLYKCTKRRCVQGHPAPRSVTNNFYANLSNQPDVSRREGSRARGCPVASSVFSSVRRQVTSPRTVYNCTVLSRCTFFFFFSSFSPASKPRPTGSSLSRGRGRSSL